jgi:hypothetical protein
VTRCVALHGNDRVELSSVGANSRVRGPAGWGRDLLLVRDSKSSVETFVGRSLTSEWAQRHANTPYETMAPAEFPFRLGYVW